MADSLQFNIGADTSGFSGGMDGVIGKLAALAAAFISAQAIIEAFGQAIDMGGRLHDLSTRTGETAGNLAILERAFENTSVGADKLGPAIAKMQKNIVDAMDGTGKAAEAFEKLAISMGELSGKSPSEQLEIIGERLSHIVDPAQRAAIAMEIFGRSGAELLPILVNFGSEVDLAKSQLGSLPDMLNRTAGGVDGLGDNLAAIKGKTTELAYGFLSEVIPALNKFTETLAGANAANIGAGMADALVGAFVNPTAAAQLLGQTLVLGVKMAGNEFVFQVNYWGQLLANTFAALGTTVIPMLGNNMRGAFELAVGGLGTILVSTITGALEALRGVAGFLGFGEELDAALTKVQGVQVTLNTVMADGAARIESSSGAFSAAFENAKANSTVIREDIFGAKALSEEIGANFAALQTDARNAVGEFAPLASLFNPTGGSLATFGQGGSLLDENAPELYSETAAELDKLSIGINDLGSSSASAGASVASAVAQINQQIGTLAGANPNQLIGKSASAREVQEIDKQLELLESEGKGDSPAAQHLRNRRQTHQDIATGATLTAMDKEKARQAAFDEWAKDPSQSLTALQEKAEQDLLREKRNGAPSQEQEEKQQESQKAMDEDNKPGTILSILQSFLNTLNKMEPRIPVANLS